MDTYSSGEDVILKKRKPYTITKQREKWTEEEHRRFLEALKLYGRAWQRIEEHIATKTAVQIRSHAQKFFSKLEREALVKGVPLGQAHGIEIPPPRPKRKPSSPYPRKTSASSTPPCKKNLLDMSIGGSHQKKHARDEIMWGRSKAACDQGKCSLGLSLFQDSPCRTTAVPLVTTPVAAAAGNGGSSDVDLGKFEGLSIDTQIKTPPKRNGAHPVNVVKGETNSASYGAVSGTTADRPVGKSTSSSGTAPFFNLSSSFSSLVVSTLLQNPAAHAAATLAASLWPSADVEASSGSTSGRRFSPVPSMAALAVATVAAASAWWATHGSLPYYPPAGLFRGGFAYAPAPTRAKTPQAATPASKTTPLSSSSDSDENPANQLNPATAESGDGRGKKKADRSSCGSNTPSSSDVETNVAVDAENEEAVHLGLGYLPAWKEVSQEGRLAFQALFSREVLPQSFSPPQDEGGAKPRRTGFKPYKRCSAEAKEGGGAATPAPAEKDSKRIRLDGEVSI